MIGSFRKHTLQVHFCEFSPNGKFLFTGSNDGTAKIWNFDTDLQKKDSQNQKLFELDDEKIVIAFEEKRRKGAQTDCLTWSCNGRYAVVSISVPVDSNNNSSSISILKVWDS